MAEIAPPSPRLVDEEALSTNMNARNSDHDTFKQGAPPFSIQLLAQIMNGLYFLESAGATFLLWLFPSLAPEPRIVRQYMLTVPHQTHHHTHSHNHHREARRRNARVRKGSENELVGEDTYDERGTSASVGDASPTGRTLSSLLQDMDDNEEDACTRTENWARIERELLEQMK